MKKTKAMAAFLIACILFATVFVGGAAAMTDPQAFTKLTNEIRLSVHDMTLRDRSGDTPIYRIDDARFVSQEDLAALLNVLALRYKLMRSMGAGSGVTEAELAELKKAVEPSALKLLISELLLNAKADSLGVTDILGTANRWQRREPDPNLTGKMDAKALVRLGLARILLWRGVLADAMNAPLPYESAAPQIAALVKELLAEYPSTVPFEQTLFQAGTPDYLNAAFDLVFSVPQDWEQGHDGESISMLVAPDEAGVVFTKHHGGEVTPMFATGFSPETARAWLIDNFTDLPTDLSPWMFAKYTPADGRFYALSSYTHTFEGFPYVYVLYSLASFDGTLSSVGAITQGGEIGAPVRAWFAQMLRDNLPEDALTALSAEFDLDALAAR